MKRCCFFEDVVLEFNRKIKRSLKKLLVSLRRAQNILLSFKEIQKNMKTQKGMKSQGINEGHFSQSELS